ncbi:MAG: hypothetical protein HND42_08070 [Armatimonadetes bacterium]|nr:hypothetical protein [Armatimonadota bacterium]NOG93180.1 hypothetical protein [Armatimonadota bacterium]
MPNEFDSKLKVHAFADGELSAEEIPGVEVLIDQDPDCKDEYLCVMQMKSVLRDKLPSHSCDEAWHGCCGRLREIDRVQQTEAVFGKFRFAIVGVVAVAIFAAAYMNRISPGSRTPMDSLATTVSAAAAGPAFVGSNERDGANWVSRKLGTNVEKPSLSQRLLQLVRTDVIEDVDGPIGRFIYTDGVTVYTLLVLPGRSCVGGDPVPGMSDVCCHSVGKLNSLCWERDGQLYILAAPKRIEDLIALVR